MEACVEADGLKTFYVKAGSGFPVVLIHGAAPGASAQVNWQLNIEPLAAAGFTVYAYDQAGFGRTDNPSDLSIEYRVTHAKAFIAALRLDRYHVVGNSVGGYIAARLALEDSRVGKLVTTLAARSRRRARRNLKLWAKSILKNCVSTYRVWKTCAHSRSAPCFARS
jgi:pimeloyl-ACP methyl ester carboxylesterase